VPLVLADPLRVTLDLVVRLVVRADPLSVALNLVAGLVVRANALGVTLDLGLLVELLLRHCSSFRKSVAPVLALSYL
jgi:hypothetical protein